MRQALTMAIACHPADLAAATALRAALENTGGVLVELTSTATTADGLVVMLSPAALADPRWLSALFPLPLAIAPVAIGEVDGKRVPDEYTELRKPNWIAFQPHSLTVTAAQVLVGLHADQAMRAQSRRLTHAASAWEATKRSDSMLLDDYRRARQMVSSLDDMAHDPWTTPNRSTIDYVHRSLEVTRKRHRRRRRWQVAAALALVLAVVAMLVEVPRLASSRLNTHTAQAAVRDDAMFSETPKWTAANAAALLLTGTGEQRDVARQALRNVLDRPWPVAWLQAVRHVGTFQLYAKGSRIAVSYRDGPTTALAVLDTLKMELLWSVPLPGLVDHVSLSPSEQVALIVGRDGAIVVDLQDRSVRTTGFRQQLAGARLISADEAIVYGHDHQLSRLDTRSGVVTPVGRYQRIIGVRVIGTTVVALVRIGSDKLALVDAVTGRVATEMLAGPDLRDTGGIDPSGRRAVMAGRDGQLWMVGAGGSHPTGIPVPVLLRGVQWASQDRLIVYSDERRAEVFHLPLGIPLGVICQDIVRPYEVRVDDGSDLVACAGEGADSVWRLPTAPTQRSEQAANAVSGGDTKVTFSGADVHLTHPSLGSAGLTLRAVGGSVTAVAVSGNGNHVLVGSSRGEVAIVEVRAGQAMVTSRWFTPDATAIASVSWAPDPLAQTRSGLAWPLGYCVACLTDDDLVQAFRQRFTGCMTDLQLSYIDSAARTALGIRVCGPMKGGM